MTEIDFSKADSLWQQASGEAQQTYDDTPVPDGTYVAHVERAEWRESKAGNPYLFWVLIIDDGVHAGRSLLKRNMLQTEKNVQFLKQDLAVCRVPMPDAVSKLDLNFLLDKRLRVKKQTNGDFENVYFDQCLGDAVPNPTYSGDTGMF
jgi:hypothetical protein